MIDGLHEGQPLFRPLADGAHEAARPHALETSKGVLSRKPLGQTLAQAFTGWESGSAPPENGIDKRGMCLRKQDRKDFCVRREEKV